MKRFAIIRVPTNGPPALVNMKNVFETEEEALARLAEIEATQQKLHHTFLDVVEFEGKVHEALPKKGILV
ncbi:MAG: hypothetical protein AAFN80_11425 [Pseudomonadota bacterium]